MVEVDYTYDGCKRCATRHFGCIDYGIRSLLRGDVSIVGNIGVLMERSKMLTLESEVGHNKV